MSVKEQHYAKTQNKIKEQRFCWFSKFHSLGVFCNRMQSLFA